MASPPPKGFGNSHRRTAWTVQLSTRPLPTVELCSCAAVTCPDGAIVNCTVMRPPRSRVSS